jgi:hypothetical protein
MCLSNISSTTTRRKVVEQRRIPVVAGVSPAKPRIAADTAASTSLLRLGFRDEFLKARIVETPARDADANDKMRRVAKRLQGARSSRSERVNKKCSCCGHVPVGRLPNVKSNAGNRLATSQWYTFVNRLIFSLLSRKISMDLGSRWWRESDEDDDAITARIHANGIDEEIGFPVVNGPNVAGLINA